MNYATLHDISRGPAVLTGETDTVQVNRFVSLSEVAKAINYEEELLYALNPSYKKKIVNGTVSSPKRMVLPNVDQNYYAQLYDVLNADLEVDRKIILASTDDVRELNKKGKEISKAAIVYHRVNPGQNLSTIANRYQVEVQDLKVWNNLKGSQIIVGQKLKIQQAKPSYITYTVKPGDTLSGIAEKFDGATVSGIKKTNGLTKANIQPGMLLKIIKG
ncbi:LysM domain protein [compost metagenome]